MTLPSKPEIGAREIARINGQMIGGMLSCGYGWVCWQIAASAPEWWAFWGMAYLGFAGGGLMMLAGVFLTARLIKNLRAWKKHSEVAVAPRADRMVEDADFEPGGRAP
ncbi:MAG: hypothetical protein AAF943_11520 [Pseudomonadota bacterium]